LNRAVMRRAAHACCVLLLGGCQVVLGLDDHELGSFDAGGGGQQPSALGGGQGGSAAGSSGSGGSRAPNTGRTGGTGGSSRVQGGSSATSSSAAAGVDAGCDVCVLKAALVHRYGFDGTGTRATDSVGNAHGDVIGTTQSGEGSVVLSGSGEYVDLPNGIVSSLTNATFEAWLRWRGGEPWQRIFDFGSSSSSIEGGQGVGETYLLLTAGADSSFGSPRAIYSTNGSSGETRLNATQDLPQNRTTHIALAFDATNKTFTLFLDGDRDASGTITAPLSGLRDVNNWLGRSQFQSDPDFEGTFYEFRIYDAALSRTQVRLSYELGPDAAF